MTLILKDAQRSLSQSRVSTLAAGRFVIKEEDPSVKTSMNSYGKAPESPARAE